MAQLNGNLDGKVALISGGASGLGLATARHFLANEAKVVIADYNPDVEKIAEALGCKGIVCDVSKHEQVEAAVNFTVEQYGKLDIAVASAGIGGDNNGIADETPENWERVNSIDYSGVLYLDKYCIMQMRKQGHGGSIVNIASMFGLVAVPDNIAYSASKGGVVNLTKAAGTAYAEEGIRVNAVCPGVIDTPLIPEEAKVQYRKLHPMKRLGEAEEVAKLINFLVSDDALFISGAVIPIDGGYTAV